MVKCFLLFYLFTFLPLNSAAQDFSVRQGCRRGTPRPQSTHLRRGGSENRTPGGDFYHGERHQLTVLVAFNDRLFKDDETATMEQWNKIFNVENMTEEPFKGSVHDYFLAQSYDDFNVSFDLQYVQVSGDAEKYASTYADDENSQYLVEDIMEVLKERDINWSLYDWNDDGYINQLLIVYAGQGMNDYNKKKYTDLIWPHQWWMSEHQKDREEGVYCDPIPVSFDDKDYLVDCYCALAELTSRDDYGSFGTLCHEYSHCFGFPDFYYGNTNYVYGWDLMDYGNYNGGGYCPAGYSAHERWLMDWLTPVECNESMTITDMPALSDQPQAYLIRNDGCENEYYIVENRQQTSWDSNLPSSGLIVFHIDYDPAIWTGVWEFPNHPSYRDDDGKTVPARERYVLFHANNSSSNRSWSYPYKENNELTNTSTPAATLWNANTDGTLLMNKPITDITITDGLASFEVMKEPTAVTERMVSTTPKVLYDLGPVCIIRCANGEIKKMMKR